MKKALLLVLALAAMPALAQQVLVSGHFNGPYINSVRYVCDADSVQKQIYDVARDVQMRYDIPAGCDAFGGTPTTGFTPFYTENNAGGSLVLKGYDNNATRNVVFILYDDSLKHYKDFQLYFNYIRSGVNSVPGTLYVDYSTDGTNFTEAQTITLSATALTSSTPPVWAEQTVDLSSISAIENPTGNLYIRLRTGTASAGTVSGGLRIDNFQVRAQWSPASPAATLQQAGSLAYTLYPNPSNGSATLQLAEPVQQATLQVYDAQGKLLTSHSVSGSSYQLSGLAPGLYTLQLRSAQGSGTARLLVH